MKKLLALFILLQFGCSQSVSELSEKLLKDSNGELFIAIVDDYAKIIHSKSFRLSKGEVYHLDRILKVAVEKLNKDENSNINLKSYKRHYCPYINKKGEKEVAVNCFCEVYDDKWKTEFRIVSGGGKCYFGGTINLRTETFYSFYINAPM